MGTSRACSLLVAFAIFAAHLLLLSPAAAVTIDFSGDHRILYAQAKSECRGTIAECMLAGDDSEFGSEFDMDSEISRRMLAAVRYISYGALGKNNIPCARRGASYYNCRPGAQANPYNRGCSAITRCRS